jgi:PAS domain S-box-containing protein
MKLSIKISILLVIGFLTVSVGLAASSILTLRQSQSQNIQLFKEEFLALGQDLFDSSSSLFFYTFEDKAKTATSSADILNIVQNIEPGNSSLIVYSLTQKKYLLKPGDAQTTALVSDNALQKDMQTNLLNLQTVFDLDNFQAFTNDSTGEISPTKIELRFYNDLGLIVGYQKPFTIGKIRIDFIQRKDDQLFDSYLIILIGIATAVLIVSIIVMMFLMRTVVLKPLNSLTQVAKELGKGNLDVAVEVKNKDEIGELGTVFNLMATKLKGYYGELESKVSERTKDLEKAKADLEHSLSDANSLQQIIKEERDRARGIVTSMGEGLIVVDKDLNVVLMNPAAERLLEVSGQQIIGRKIEEIVPKILRNGQEIPPADRPSTRTLAGASMNITIEDNISFKLISGKEFSVALATTPLRGEAGISGVVEIFRDITSEKQSRGAIEQQVVERTKELSEKNTALTAAKEEISRGWLQIQMEKARLLASVNSISLGFLMVDASGKTLIKNPAVEKAIGIKSDFSNIDAIDQLLGPAFGLKVKFSKCVEERTPINDHNISFNNKYFRLFMAPIFSTDNTLSVIGVVILIQDETEQKVMDRSKDEFFSIASHELRTPLTAIRGNTSLIEQYYGEKLKAEPELEEMITDIHESSIRLINIVNDFLNVSRLEQGKMEYKIENFDLPLLIDKKIEEISSLSVEKHIPIVFQRPTAPLPAAYSDKDRTGEVLLNLLGNALKYSEKGTINVQMSMLQGFIKVSVTDTGKGIAPEQQSLLFRKFQQAGKSIMTRDTTRATGLGLYISKLITEQMGGQIFLEKSEPGVGSTFSFTVPLQQVGAGQVQ